CKGLLDGLLHAVKKRRRDCRHNDGGHAGEQEGLHCNSPKENGMLWEFTQSGASRTALSCALRGSVLAGGGLLGMRSGASRLHRPYAPFHSIVILSQRSARPPLALAADQTTTLRHRESCRANLHIASRLISCQRFSRINSATCRLSMLMRERSSQASGRARISRSSLPLRPSAHSVLAKMVWQ